MQFSFVSSGAYFAPKLGLLPLAVLLRVFPRSSLSSTLILTPSCSSPSCLHGYEPSDEEIEDMLAVLLRVF